MLPRTILDRLHDRKGRFSGLRLSERDIEEVLRDAASGLDLDLSGASLVEDVPFFISDAIGRNNYYEFVNVDLGGTNLALQGFDVLMECIVQFRDLESLNLRNNALPKEAAVALAKILGAKSKLRILDVHDNFLGDSGAAVIAGAFTTDLSQSKHYRSALMSLKVLDLSSNHIGDLGILALCRGLLHFAKHLASIDKTSALVSLRLDRNKLGDRSAICLAQLLRSCHSIGTLHIEELSVCDNPIGPDGLSALLTATRRVRPEAVDESVMDGNSSRLMLDENGILIGGGSELDLALSQLSESIRQREGGSVAPSDGGPITVLRASGCKVTVPVLEDLARTLRSGGCQLHAVDLGMTRAVARDLSQQPGFKEAILSLNESIARSATIKSVNLGDLLEVCSTAAVVLPVDSPESASLRQVVEALNSMTRILRMDNSMQRQMWYAGHYNDISSAALSPPRASSNDSLDDRRGEPIIPPNKYSSTGASFNSALHETTFSMEQHQQQQSTASRGREDAGPLLVPGIPIEKGELDKIRRSHGSVFSELSHGIHELSEAARHAHSTAEEAMHSSSSYSQPHRSPGQGGGNISRGRSVTRRSNKSGSSRREEEEEGPRSWSPSARSGSPLHRSGSGGIIDSPTTPYFPHSGLLGETMASAIRRAESAERNQRLKESRHKKKSSSSSSGSRSSTGSSSNGGGGRGDTSNVSPMRPSATARGRESPTNYSSSSNSNSNSRTTARAPPRSPDVGTPNAATTTTSTTNRAMHTIVRPSSPDGAVPRLYDEASVEALVKAAVKSALSLAADQQQQYAAAAAATHGTTTSTTSTGAAALMRPLSFEDATGTGSGTTTMGASHYPNDISYNNNISFQGAHMGGGIGSYGNMDRNSMMATNNSNGSLHVVEARLALLEDRVEGIEAMDTLEGRARPPHNSSSSSSGGGKDPKDAIVESLSQTVSRLEARLAQVEAEFRAQTDARAREDLAVKEFIVHMGEEHAAFADRLAHVEGTVEQDSQTSIALLDLLVKKLDS